MNELLKAVDEMPLIVKVILCLPCVDVFYGICRIVKGAVKNDLVWIVLAILTVFPGAFFIWILDLIWVLTKGHALLLGEDMFS
ncbi:MAG: hypothetical protein HFG28_15960 [Eubacterium sp.]|jgi:hypothetical protein|nr:hypothetical protein [Clostridia bacterium]MCI9128620.1 hypothetical protein [Eubacterium sp.]